MSNTGFRLVVLNALAVILLGMFLGGFPLVFVVVREAYHQAPPITLGGDYRGWMMAHLEGLLNGMLMILVAGATRIAPMAPGRERLMVPALLVAGWGNAGASVLAPLLGVRGMVFDASPANNLVAGLFTLALVASIMALTGAVRHLLSAR